MLQAFIELRKIHALFDSAEKWLESQLGVPLCTPNCGLCCQQTHPVHSLEATLIVSSLIGQGITHYIDAARSWLIERSPHVVTYEGMPFGPVTGKVKEEWDYLSRTPCIFYAPQAKICSIHSMRPLPCRALGVTRLPSRCPRPLGAGESAETRMLISGEPGMAIRAKVEKVIRGLNERNPDWTKRGFLPTMIFRQAREKEFRELIADNRIASAKLVGLNYSLQALWQSDLEIERDTTNLVKA